MAQRIPTSNKKFHHITAKLAPCPIGWHFVILLSSPSISFTSNHIHISLVFEHLLSIPHFRAAPR